MFADQRTHPSDVAKRLKELKRESGSLRDSIDAELVVLTLIEKSLGSFRSEGAIAWLAGPALDDKLPRARELAAAALGETDATAAVRPLVKALRDANDRVRLTAAASLGRLKAAEAVDDLLKLLHEKEAWPVRGAAIEALGEIGERRAVGPLVQWIGKEEGRLQLDCAKALAKLTGENFGAVPEVWKRWWEEHRAEFEKGDAEPVGGGGGPAPGSTDGGYYGIPVQTERAIFILDVSGSMSKSSKDPGRDPADGEVSKIESAKNELARVIREFSPRGRFNVIVFNDVVKKWKETMVPSNAAMKAEAQAFVKDLSAASTTNIYDAMAAAFAVAGMGARDKYYDLGADTIFLLSDGSPTKSDGSLDDWEKVLAAVAEWNRLKRVTIHAIGVGGHNVAFMSRLASENGGQYVAR
ncbi:MAG: HEAT repeat domain-containing protein [Planctomycetes bacterium]|nr:HEAT repeat domain-containing protein [Planctomycetota bacterium]